MEDDAVLSIAEMYKIYFDGININDEMLKLKEFYKEEKHFPFEYDKTDLFFQPKVQLLPAPAHGKMRFISAS